MKLQTLLVFTATFIIGVLALTEQQLKKLDEVNKPCIEKTGATEETGKQITNNQWTGDPVMRSYMFCMFKLLELVDDNGDFNSKKLKSLVETAADNQEEADAVYKKCAVKKNSAEETAYEAAKCFHLSLKKFSPVL